MNESNDQDETKNNVMEDLINDGLQYAKQVYYTIIILLSKASNSLQLIIMKSRKYFFKIS